MAARLSSCSEAWPSWLRLCHERLTPGGSMVIEHKCLSRPLIGSCRWNGACARHSLQLLSTGWWRALHATMQGQGRLQIESQH